MSMKYSNHRSSINVGRSYEAPHARNRKPYSARVLTASVWHSQLIHRAAFSSVQFLPSRLLRIMSLPGVNRSKFPSLRENVCFAAIFTKITSPLIPKYARKEIINWHSKFYVVVKSITRKKMISWYSRFYPAIAKFNNHYVNDKGSSWKYQFYFTGYSFAELCLVQ